LSIPLNEIKSPLKKELVQFDSFFQLTFKTRVALLDAILNYIIKRKGKQIRPLLVLLTAALHGEVTDKAYRGATLIELLHTATLVHDDVVDDSMERRGFFSINALWKNKTSVLIGDYLLSRGMLLALNNKDYDFLEITSEAVKLMSEGELMQMEKARTLDIREEVYFDIIRMKTASLISASCAIGAASASNKPDQIQNMKEFGALLGIAFQIKDDLLDFSLTITGKPKGSDLKEKKLTLPLIYALKQAGSDAKRKIIHKIAKRGKITDTYHSVRSFIEEHGGFTYASGKMHEFSGQAADILTKYPDSAFKDALLKFIIYNEERNS